MATVPAGFGIEYAMIISFLSIPNLLPPVGKSHVVIEGAAGLLRMPTGRKAQFTVNNQYAKKCSKSVGGRTFVRK
jgi:hypothetical protein